MWVSPNGDGWSIAAKLRDAGSKVVYYCPNKNGSGYLPSVTEAEWFEYALKSDLVICDGNSASRETRRSWEPSELVLQLAQLNHRGIAYLGPLPTTELLENDDKYREKILARFSMAVADSTHEGVNVTLSIAPNGGTWLVWRALHGWGEDNGPRAGNLGDIVIPTNPTAELTKNVRQLVEFLRGLNYNGYINLGLTINDGRVEIHRIDCRFIYPGIFCQFPDLLPSDAANGEHGNVRLAVSLLRLDEDSPTEAEHLLREPGFFGAEIHRDLETGEGRSHGTFLGAFASAGPSFSIVQDKVYRHLATGLRLGWGYRENIGLRVGHDLELLQKWGYV